MIGLTLGPVVHLGPVFLIDKDDCDVLGLGKEQGIRMADDAFRSVPEDEGAEFGAFCPAWSGGFHKLAGAHCKAVSADDEVDSMLVDVGASLRGTSKFPEAPEEFWGSGLLSIWWRVTMGGAGFRSGRERGCVGNGSGTPQPGGLRQCAECLPPWVAHVGHEIGLTDASQRLGRGRRKLER